MAKVLLADDSITIHKVVEIILTAKGFTLKAVPDGDTGLETVRTFKPDVVLADIDMPGLNGYELSAKIKANPATKDIPVILLAGAFETLDEALAKKVGANGTLIKPFESEDLLGRLREVLSPEAVAQAPAPKAEATEAEILEVEGLEMDELEPEDEMIELAEEGAPEEDIVGFEPFEEELAVEAEPAEVVPEEEAELAEVVPEEEAELAEVVSEAEAELTAVEPVLDEAELTPVEGTFEEGLVEPEPVGFEAIAEEPMHEMPSVEVPGSEAFTETFQKLTNEKITEFLGTMDMKAALMEAIAPTLSESVEEVLWEIAPELMERLAKQTLKESMSDLKKEVETVLWETVPELAENLISKEIKRIREES